MHFVEKWPNMHEGLNFLETTFVNSQSVDIFSHRDKFSDNALRAPILSTHYMWGVERGS